MLNLYKIHTKNALNNHHLLKIVLKYDLLYFLCERKHLRLRSHFRSLKK